MTLQPKHAAVAAVLLALAIFALWQWIGFSGGESAVGADRRSGTDAPRSDAPNLFQNSTVEEREPVEAERSIPEAAPRPTTGHLIIRATDLEGDPVPDLGVVVGSPGTDPRISGRRGTTDAEGIARFDALPVGRIWVQNVRHDHLVRAAIEPGIATEVALVLPQGITVTGVVVDMHGVAVSGAEVILAPRGRADRDIEHVANTDAVGRFRLTSCPKCYLGARAKGHAPSRLHSIVLEAGASTDIRIELPAPGGGVTGVVRTSDGAPVRGACVQVGKSPLRSQLALVRTDEEGRFQAVGVAAGEHPIEVRAAGLCPWQGQCQVQAGASAALDITLRAGVSCTGVVVNEAGAPLAGIEIQIGSWGDLAHYRAHSDENGAFRLDGLPAWEVEIRAADRKHGAAKARVHGASGETVTCKLVLGLGLLLRGRVLAGDGKPVLRALVDARDRELHKNNWGRTAFTDRKGEFSIRNCPEGRLLTVAIRGRGFRAKRMDDVDPRDGALIVTLEPAPLPSARLVGQIVRPDGEPAAYAGVWAWERKGEQHGTKGASAQGAFVVGPLAPGDWRLTIRAAGLPPLVTAWRTLAANQEADLGTIRLVTGGTVRVETRGPDRPALRMSLWAGSRWSGLRREGDAWQSDLVPPGAARISVFGNGVGSQLIPVEVRAGEESQVILNLQAGYAQEFRFSRPKTPSMRRVRIAKGDLIVADVTSRARIHYALPATWRRWLAPGDYVATVESDGLRGQARFTVRAGKNDLIEIDMR